MDKAAETRTLAIQALTDPPPASLLAVPLDYIHAEHFRHRTMCSVLDTLCRQDKVDINLLEAAVFFLANDFAVHLIDEEEDLYPLLRRRAKPDDDIAKVLEGLNQDKAPDRFDPETIVAAITNRQSDGDRQFDAETSALVTRFAANEHRHLICENAILLPLARARLTPDDLRNLGRRIAARRGIPYPEASDAH